MSYYQPFSDILVKVCSVIQGCHGQGKKSGKWKIFQAREFQFQSGKFRKNEKSQGNVRELQNFPKKFIVYRLLKSIISINCKRFMVRNITFIIFMV